MIFNFFKDYGCVWFNVKCFLNVKYFQVKIFSRCLVAFQKMFGKYFLIFGCIPENAL